MSVNTNKSTWWRPLIAVSALTALAVTPFLFASGVDNDSPFNMPNWNTLSVISGTAAEGRYSAVSAMSVETESGATVQLVDHLAPKARLLIDHVKVQTQVGTNGGVSAPPERLVAAAGSNVQVMDSAPIFGNTTVAVQGRFWLSGDAVIGLDTHALYSKPVAFLVIGKENASTHQFESVYQIVPLGYTAGILNIQLLAKTMAGEASLHGLTAMLVHGHLASSISGAPQFALESTVQFEIGASPKFLVDTDAKLPH